MKKAVYAGSFDPVTNGHLWIIAQASRLFDKLVVAIGENVDKQCTISVEDRFALLLEVTKNYPNIEITRFKNEYLVHYARRIKANYIVRGIRNSTDYEYERSMRYINSDLCNDVDTIFLMPPRDYVEISSSMVKGLVGSVGWEAIVQTYVPEAVFLKMQLLHKSRVE